MKTVVIVDDNRQTRLAVKEILSNESEFKVIGEADDGIQGFEVTNVCKPDVLITDLKMPRLNGIALTERVNKECPQTHILMLSQYGDKNYIDAAISAGASGYLHKKYIVKRLSEAIFSILTGKIYIAVK